MIYSGELYAIHESFYNTVIWIYNAKNECYTEIIKDTSMLLGLIFSMSLMLRCLIISSNV